MFSTISKATRSRGERKRAETKVKMGWADYTFTKLEMCYAGDAIEVSSFTYPSTFNSLQRSHLPSVVPFVDFTFRHNDVRVHPPFTSTSTHLLVMTPI